MTEGTFFRENDAMHDVTNGRKWKYAHKCRWFIFPIFIWGTLTPKKAKTLINDQGCLFREKGALYGVANGPKRKNAQKCRWVIH